ncbi:MAG: hypothetical protein ACRCUZ_08725 [Shewanella sp.]
MALVDANAAIPKSIFSFITIILCHAALKPRYIAVEILLKLTIKRLGHGKGEMDHAMF